MKIIGNIVVVLVLVSLAVVGYCTMNPQHIPMFLRWEGRGLELPRANSPMQNFHPPQFGSP
jgi:hypothetical protein